MGDLRNTVCPQCGRHHPELEDCRDYVLMPLAQPASYPAQLQYIIKCPDGRRWAVQQAVSLKAACAAINHARVTGSIGHTDTQTEYVGANWATSEPRRTILADVHQINSDGTLREAYTPAY